MRTSARRFRIAAAVVLAVLSIPLIQLNAQQTQAQPLTFPAWLRMVPNYRADDASRIWLAAHKTCEARYPVQALGRAHDRLLNKLGVKHGEQKGNAVAYEHLQKVLRRQEERNACQKASGADERIAAIEATEPDQFDLPVYASPGRGLLGKAIIRITDKQRDEFSFAYVPLAGPEVPWVLDQMSQGMYGDDAHTVLAKRGDWLQLPRDPFPQPVWINWRHTFQSPPDLQPLFGGEVYSIDELPATTMSGRRIIMKEAQVVFLRREGARIVFRHEGPLDMTCGEEPTKEDIRRAKSLPSYMADLRRILDDRLHIRAAVTYWEGC